MLELELLQVALGNRKELSRTPSPQEWNAIYRFAEEQAIVGVMFGGIERLPKNQVPYLDLLMEWLGQTEFLRKQNALANEDCKKITKIFREAGFKTSIMKGQGNALRYGELGALRNSGDIDIWVSGGFRRVNDFVQKLSPTNEINELEIQLDNVCDTPIEVHYRPFIMRNPWTNSRLQKFFNKEAENCFNNGLFTTTRFNLIHQLAHIRLHLFTEGVGMKQLIDYYFVLLNSKEPKDEIMKTVDYLGMKRFAEAMMWVMKEVFLIPEELLLCMPDEKGGRLLINDVMKSGNFGRADSELKARRLKSGYGVWALFVRNLRYTRFDRWDWICGPLWRTYHRIWKLIKGYK